MATLKYTVFAIIVSLVGCGGDDDPIVTIDMSNNRDDIGISDVAAEDTGPLYASFSERPCPEESTLTYENFGQGFMLNLCTACHHSDLPEGMRQDAPVATNLDAVDDVRGLAERIWIRSGDQNLTMPPRGGPSDTERAELGEWLACGAP